MYDEPEEIDESQLFQSLMQVQLESFAYSDEWRAVNALGQDQVRTAIGQQVATLMPDWVHLLDQLSFDEQATYTQNPARCIAAIYCR